MDDRKPSLCGVRIVINETVYECHLEKGHEWAHMDDDACGRMTWTDIYNAGKPHRLLSRKKG